MPRSFAKWVLTIALFPSTPPPAALARQNQTLKASVPSSTTVVPDDRFATVRAHIVDLVARGEIPSMAVAVAQRGKIVWEEAFGWADRENMVAATPNTIYKVGSLSKSIMATGMMKLIQDGRVSLDDAVDRLIRPAVFTVYEGRASDIKVKHLLNMTAGIPHGSLGRYEWRDVPQTVEQKNEYVKNMPLVVFPPGEVFEYSNLSMGMPEIVIERVTKTRFPQYMKAEVFQPLGMNRTAVWLDQDQEGLAVGYTSRNVRMGRSAYLVPPGGLGFSSSAHDLARFGMFHLKSHRSDQRQILTDQTLDLMHSYDKGPQGTYFTLGWFNVGGGKLITDGQVGGANSNLTLIPSDGVAIATLANITAGNSGAIADDMADEIANVFKPTPGAERKKGAQRHIQRFATPYKPTPEFRGTWEGLIKAYGGDVPISLFFEDTGTVQLELDGQSRTPLSSATFNTFYELRGEFDGKIKTVESRDVAQQSKMSITARWTKDRLYGYVLARFSSERGDCAVPMYLSLTRKP